MRLLRILFLVCLAFPAVADNFILDGDGNQSWMPFVIYNGWTNDVLVIFQDSVGNEPVVLVKKGYSYHGLTGVNDIYVMDLYAYQNLITNSYEGNYDQAWDPYTSPMGCDQLTADGSTNGAYFELSLYPLDSGIADGNGVECFNPGANLTQTPDILYQLNFSQVKDADDTDYASIMVTSFQLGLVHGSMLSALLLGIIGVRWALGMVSDGDEWE